MDQEEIDDNSPGEFENVKVNTSSRLSANKTFFFEKKNDEVFACEEQEAAIGKYRSKFKFVGWSDGTTYIKTIQAAHYKPGQVIPKKEAEDLLRLAFDKELKVAKRNLKSAITNNTPVPRPRRVEWHFDGSVPEEDRSNIAGGKKYGNATAN